MWLEDSPERVPNNVLLMLVVALCGAAPLSSGQAAVAAENLSLRNEVQHAIERGQAWLEKNQDPKGFWSNADHPAITALALVALQDHVGGQAQPPQKPAVKRGYDILLTYAQPDGGIYKKELQNYNTSISVMALLAANRPEYTPVILRARQFLIELQSDFGEPGKMDTALDGGIGYGNKQQRADLVNTTLALEALYYSKRLAQDEGLASARDLNWTAAIHFIQSCQNLPGYNKEPWPSDDPQNRGGFVYYPGKSMAGETNLPSGRVALRSYGSISYSGLLSYIYASVKRDDPRVTAVFGWLRQNYTLEENPGLGPQGLFYYYHTMAKALTTAGTDYLETPDGRKNWREELALKLINVQQKDGSWANENGRWWEKDPILVTAYALISLEMIQSKL